MPVGGGCGTYEREQIALRDAYLVVEEAKPYEEQDHAQVAIIQAQKDAWVLALSNVIVAIPDTTKIDALLCSIQGGLTTAYTQVFKNKDEASWNPKTGQYTRNVGFTYQNCSASPSTSLC